LAVARGSGAGTRPACPQAMAWVAWTRARRPARHSAGPAAQPEIVRRFQEPAMRILLLLLSVTGLSGCSLLEDKPSAPPPAEVATASPSNSSTDDTSNPSDLTFLGTVTSIEAADTGDRLKNWVVTARVDRIVSGRFSGGQFSFAIHSPTLSGLEVGKQCRIRATRTQKGYLVDQYQWRRSP
jgi:hypothetical protein